MNNFYSSIALFLHIVGALGVFISLGLEWTGLQQIRSALQPEQVRSWMGIFKSSRKLGFISMLTTVITGLFMMVTDWGGVAWIFVSIGALVLMIGFSAALTGPRMADIWRALTVEKGTLSKTFYRFTNQSILWISIQTRLAIALGIIFLKIAKPELNDSLLTIGIAIVLGIASTMHIQAPCAGRRKVG